ncbi:hypothetical protein QQG55_25800 [Brugia pahangi]
MFINQLIKLNEKTYGRLSRKNFRNGHGTRTGSNDFIDGIKVDDKSTEQSFLDKFYFGTAKNAVGKSDQQLQMALNANDRKSGSL